MTEVCHVNFTPTEVSQSTNAAFLGLNAARNYLLKIGQVGVQIHGNTMHRDPATGGDSQRTNFISIHPHTRVHRRSPRLHAVVRECVDYALLETRCKPIDESIIMKTVKRCKAKYLTNASLSCACAGRTQGRLQVVQDRAT